MKAILLAVLLVTGCGMVSPMTKHNRQDPVFRTYVDAVVQAYEDGYTDLPVTERLLDVAWRYQVAVESNRRGKAATEFRGQMERNLKAITGLKRRAL